VKTRARLLATFPLCLALAWFGGCDAKQASAGASSPVVAAPATPPNYTVEVVRTLPHDRDAFTQGLVYLDGDWLESTGLNGKSTLRRVEVATGRVLKQVRVPSQYFAEGMTVLGGKIYQLTWQAHKGFVYDLATFALEREFEYTGEGWGLTTDGHSLILSDGTDQIRFLEPTSFAVTRTVRVVRDGQPLRLLNELEYVKGEIYANIWQSQSIARIDPASGRLLGIIDCFNLLPVTDQLPNTDVLNGIAYDAATDRLWITGKNWPKIFEVRLKPAP
jgi:hypothetical protein